MKTIKNILLTTFQNKEWWNYYGGIFDCDIFTSKDCKSFIEEFFEKSGKTNLLRYLESQATSLESERWQHIVYTFLLGIYIYKKSSYRTSIDNEIRKLFKKGLESEIKFEFVWFLICLFHDLSYNVENNLSNDIFLDFKKYKLRTVSGVPSLFKGLPIRYYYYRRMQGKNDHGVFAGLTMFKQLYEIRKKQKDNYDKCHTDKEKILCWEKPLEKIYNYAAWVVACHNMWFKHSNETSEALECTLYRLFGLDNLILNDDGRMYKHECRKYPIFFLFCIIDTIEVIKVTCGIEELGKISLEILEDGDAILIDISEARDQKRLMANIKSLDKWITDVTVESNYRLKIKL